LLVSYIPSSFAFSQSLQFFTASVTKFYSVSSFLGCIKYMKCGLLRSMFPASVSLYLSCGFTQLCCAELIDVLIGVETLGGLRNIVLIGGPCFPMDLMPPLPNLPYNMTFKNHKQDAILIKICSVHLFSLCCSLYYTSVSYMLGRYLYVAFTSVDVLCCLH